jgi:hypothetical protein
MQSKTIDDTLEPNIGDYFFSMFGFSNPTDCFKQMDLFHGFRLPIEYLASEETKPILENIDSDLELTATLSNETMPMSHYLCAPSNEFGKQMIRPVFKAHTTNIDFLKDTQLVIENMDLYPSRLSNEETETYINVWKEVKENSYFLDKHSYMQWSVFENLNRSSSFLQIYSFFNIISPIFALFIPVFFLVFPFLILKLRGVPILFNEYLEVLRDIAKHHFIGKMLNIRSFSIENLAYILLMAGMYVMQTYQNVMSCIKYYNAIKQMNENLCFLRVYLKKTIGSMQYFIERNKKIANYSRFCLDIETHLSVLKEYYDKLEPITCFSHSASKMGDLGYMLELYYLFYIDMDFEESMRYAVGFHGYCDLLCGLQTNLREKHIGKAEFSTSSKKPKISDQYYPPLKGTNECVRNTCKLDKNMIISGVNASGKTTMLKTTALNIIFSQIFGCGFYSKYRVGTYTHIHSYLNIPDTSGRDSLFQAESRRCKEIIDIIGQSKGATHFCIFDELYSGTNPKEATKSAICLLEYLAKQDNVKFILTTHYVGVCSKFKKSKVVRNMQMNVLVDEIGKFKYTYRIKKGISRLEGGIEILKNMEYPEEIIQSIVTM